MQSKFLTSVARILIALTFIFSGFVKLVDPMGSAIKLEEYFSEDVLNLPFLVPYALPLAILLILVELLLGVMLLSGFKPKFTLWGLAVLMLVFLFLTWYSAYFNKVTDCGCFGDAVKLTPWQTFYKNVFFGALVLYLLFHIDQIVPWFGKTAASWIPFIALLGSLYISYYVLQHLPIIDFRPFAVGKSIPEGMQYTGDEDFPPIHDFVLENDTDDLTDSILQAPKALLIVSYNLNRSDQSVFKNLQKLGEEAIRKNYPVYLLSASSMDEFKALKAKYKLPFDMLYCDETTLKTIIRANPGIVLLKKGVVAGKWNGNDVDKIVLNE